MSSQSLTTPAMFMVRALVLPMSRNTAMFRPATKVGWSIQKPEQVGGEMRQESKSMHNAQGRWHGGAGTCSAFPARAAC